jgi:hypothetical protein
MRDDDGLPVNYLVGEAQDSINLLTEFIPKKEED